MTFIFANVWFFDDMFNVYEFQEKHNIEYYWGRIAKTDVFHGLRKGGAGRMLTGIWNRAALPQTPNQRKTWKPEALIADT